MNAKDVIMHLFGNANLRDILINLYEGRDKIDDLREMAKHNPVLERDLEFLDLSGIIVGIFEKDGATDRYRYKLNDYGKKIAEIILGLEKKA